MDMQKKYGSTPFDQFDPNDALAERARLAVISAMTPIVLEASTDSRSTEYLMGGMLIGFVHVMQSCLVEGEETDAAIRAGILQIAPWAVDHARAFSNKPPLTDT